MTPAPPGQSSSAPRVSAAGVGGPGNWRCSPSTGACCAPAGAVRSPKARPGCRRACPGKPVPTGRRFWESRLCARRVPQPEAEVVAAKGARDGRPLRPPRATVGIPTPWPFIHLARSVSPVTILGGPERAGLAEPATRFPPPLERRQDFASGERRGRRDPGLRAPPRVAGGNLSLRVLVSRQASGKTKLNSNSSGPFRDFNPWKGFPPPLWEAAQIPEAASGVRAIRAPSATCTQRAVPAFEPPLPALFPALSGPRRALETWRAQER